MFITCSREGKYAKTKWERSKWKIDIAEQKPTDDVAMALTLIRQALLCTMYTISKHFPGLSNRSPNHSFAD